MARALKVWRTPIGFHDAYVAAPTQKAALEAWGATHNLFARGQVEEVTDPTLTEAPLAAPGTVVKRLRGTAAEQVAALPKATIHEPIGAAADAKPKPRTPRPGRVRLEKAEAASAAAEARHADEMAELAKEEAALTAKRRRLEADHAAERERLAAAAKRARKDYEEAIANWEG